tara:strand:- start:877 stop:984 length:108 start_codon:yes stop_codon:yes gene_type:complete
MGTTNTVLGWENRITNTLMEHYTRALSLTDISGFM